MKCVSNVNSCIPVCLCQHIPSTGSRADSLLPGSARLSHNALLGKQQPKPTAAMCEASCVLGGRARVCLAFT
jgi:hypothetical protein